MGGGSWKAGRFQLEVRGGPRGGGCAILPPRQDRVTHDYRMRGSMSQPTSTSTARPEFLKFLAASHYVAALGAVTALLYASGIAHANPPKNQPAAEVVSTPPATLTAL